MPVFPEQVAVIVALPAPAPLTTPFEFTVAAVGLLLDHAMVCPLMTFPCASFTVADNATVAPTAIEAVGGDTVTVVTTGAGGGGAATVTLAVPDFPAVAAVIVAEPAATPVTTPLELTVAAAGLLVDQAIVWPVITLPCASFTVAERVTVPPTAIDDDGGETVTVVTTGAGGGGGGGGGGSDVGAVTVTSAVPFFPAVVAVMVAEPGPIPATTPLELTTAADALEVDHETTSPEMTSPSASFTVAARVVVVPATIDVVAGDTLTVVTTGVGVGVGSVVVPEPEQTEIAGTRTTSHE